MRCHICDRILEQIEINPQTKKIEPCHKCQGVIQDTVDHWDEEEEANDRGI